MLEFEHLPAPIPGTINVPLLRSPTLLKVRKRSKLSPFSAFFLEVENGPIDSPSLALISSSFLSRIPPNLDLRRRSFLDH